MLKDIKILILEDDLETNQKILGILKEIENEKEVSFGVTILPDYIQTEEFINKNPQIKFDVLLLDRDCYLGGSFHVVNLNNFDLEKVISISSIPKYNKQAVEKGVKRTIWKDYQNLDKFSDKLKNFILEII